MFEPAYCVTISPATPPRVITSLASFTTLSQKTYVHNYIFVHFYNPSLSFHSMFSPISDLHRALRHIPLFKETCC